jgi:hypothetical protein
MWVAVAIGTRCTPRPLGRAGSWPRLVTWLPSGNDVAAFDMVGDLSQTKNRTLLDVAVEMVTDYSSSADGDRAFRQLR